MYKISVLENAVFSGDVYHQKTNFDKLKKGWQIMTVNLKPALHFHNDLFARTYLHYTGGRADAAVIAYRGTMKNYYGNYIDDAEIEAGLMPFQERLAGMYYAVNFHYLVSKFGLLPSLTGHSLGGAYAQLVAIQNHPHPETIVFNSPGVGGTLDIPTLKDYDFIQNFDSRDGFINHRGGTTVGKVTWLDIQNGDAAAKASYDHQTIGEDITAFVHDPDSFSHNAEAAIGEQHAIANVIAYLKNHPAVGREVFV